MTVTPRTKRNEPNKPRRRITAIIGHLEIISAALELAETAMADNEEGAIWGRPATSPQSTISTRNIADPTAGALTAISPVMDQRRALNQAVEAVERAVTHLRLETLRAQGADTVNTKDERRCPEMILDHDGYDDVMRACGALTHTWQRPDNSTAWRQDGLCLDHGLSADTEARRANDSNLKRQRRHAAT